MGHERALLYLMSIVKSNGESIGWSINFRVDFVL